MSGIGGICSLSGKRVEPAQLQAMAAAMAYRGADQEQYYVDGSIGFFQRLFYDTKESLQHRLPQPNKTNRYILTFHGRVDNRKELYDKVHCNSRLDETTDYDLVLAAYEKWHESCVEHLLGDFAFAIWDDRERALFCARDHMGVKPLTYYLSKNFFAFCSTVKGILALGGVEKRLNRERTAEYLCWEVTDNSSTFFKNIFRLPPAHWLRVKNDRLTLQRYHQFEFNELLYPKRTDYEEHFLDIFTEAVRCRVRSCYPVGSFLSGGLDSSSIVSTVSGRLQHEKPSDFSTFSAIFDTIASCDERKYFQDVLVRYGLKNFSIHADSIHPGPVIEKCVSEADEPSCSAHFFMKWNLSSVAEFNGMRVMLDGHDGDTAVSYGYEALSDLALQGRLISMVRLYQEYNGSLSYYAIFKRIIRRYQSCLQLRLPLLFGLPPEARALVGSLDLINNDVSAGTRLACRIHEVASLEAIRGQSEREFHMRSLTHPRQSHLLEFLEMMASRWKLCYRFPYFDLRLLQFCLSLPSLEKIAGGYNRAIVRRALSEYLPISIRTRREKMNFADNLLNAFTNIDREWLLNSLDKLGAGTYSFIDKRCLQKYKNALFFDKTSDVETKLMVIHPLIRVVALDKWLGRNNLDV